MDDLVAEVLAFFVPHDPDRQIRIHIVQPGGKGIRVARMAVVLRVLERNVILPGSRTNWRFQIAQSREALESSARDIRASVEPPSPQARTEAVPAPDAAAATGTKAAQ